MTDKTADELLPCFKEGDFVRKKGDKGQWHGKIVGTYSTDCTPKGYAVESLYEKNSVQIYPANALEPWNTRNAACDVGWEDVEKLKQMALSEVMKGREHSKHLREVAFEIISESFNVLKMKGHLQTGWRDDWENAPKDGTDFMAYSKKSGEAFITYYKKGLKHPYLFENAEGVSIQLQNLTHWMSLPSAPSNEPTGGEG